MRYEIFVNGKKEYEEISLQNVVDDVYLDGLMSPEMHDMFDSRVAEEVDMEGSVNDILYMAVTGSMTLLRGRSRQVYRILYSVVKDLLDDADGNLVYSNEPLGEVRIRMIEEDW